MSDDKGDEPGSPRTRAARRAMLDAAAADRSRAFDEVFAAARGRGATKSAVRGLLQDATRDFIRQHSTVTWSRRGFRRHRIEAPKGTVGETNFVYMIGSNDGPIKIGISNDPDKRRATLQTGYHRKLYIMFEIEVPRDLAVAIERESHKRLHQHRLAGEWFAADRFEAMAVIKAVVAEMT